MFTGVSAACEILAWPTQTSEAATRSQRLQEGRIEFLEKESLLISRGKASEDLGPTLGSHF